MSEPTTQAVPQDPPAKRSRKTSIEPVALSARDLAALFSISIRQVWSMHAAGAIGPMPLKLAPRITRWDAHEIHQWWRDSRTVGRLVGRKEWLAKAQQGGDR